jgi:hypothetical protein
MKKKKKDKNKKTQKEDTPDPNKNALALPKKRPTENSHHQSTKSLGKTEITVSTDKITKFRGIWNLIKAL